MSRRTPTPAPTRFDGEVSLAAWTALVVITFVAALVVYVVLAGWL